jgi:pimeloyl-ACP methyl ester carboxylesterase
MQGGTVVVGVATVAGAGLAVELRHRRRLAADPLDALLSTPLAGEQVPVVSADGTLIHAEVFGPHGAPTLVLVPGWTEKLQIYDLLTRVLLDRGYRIVSFDLRGQGQSGAPVEGDQAIERYGEDVEAVLAAAAGGREDVILAGHSMGGMSIMAWAEAFQPSARVRAVGLLNTGAVGLADASTLLPSSTPTGARRRIGGMFIFGAAPPPPLSTPLSRAILRHVAFGPTASEAQVAFFERMGWECPATVRITAGATLATLDVTAGVTRLDVPTLVLTGAQDRLTPPVLSQQLAELLPNPVELKILPETGHMTPLERPAELADALATLAAGVGLFGGDASLSGSSGGLSGVGGELSGGSGGLSDGGAGLSDGGGGLSRDGGGRSDDGAGLSDGGAGLSDGGTGLPG